MARRPTPFACPLAIASEQGRNGQVLVRVEAAAAAGCPVPSRASRQALLRVHAPCQTLVRVSEVRRGKRVGCYPSLPLVPLGREWRCGGLVAWSVRVMLLRRRACRSVALRQRPISCLHSAQPTILYPHN